MFAVLNDLVEASETICKHSFGLAHIRHFVFVASLDSGVDDGFSAHLSTTKICS